MTLPYFCIFVIIPFEEELDLHLNKLEFPLCKKGLYQVWLFHFKRLFPIYTCKIVSPLVARTDSRGSWFEQTWIYIMSESFHVNLNSSGSVILEKKLLQWPHKFFCFCDYLPFEQELALYLYNLESRKDDLYQVWLQIVCWFWRRRFIFNINTCKYGFPYCSPSQPLGTMIWTNLNIHYIRKLSCKYDLFWLSGSWEDFKWPHPIFAFFWLSHLSRGAHP
jgi:hypothetical protein